MAKRVVRYRLGMARRRYEGVQASKTPSPTVPNPPSVTLFITNMNNRWPLELTLKSAFDHTDYPNLKVWIGDNASTDGSQEFLKGLQSKIDLTILERETPLKQHLWYDQILRTADTDYWIGCHEDILFTGRDWVWDMIAFMERSPQTQLLGGEYFPPKLDMPEPHGNRIDLQESLSTWLFCVRTSLRDRIDTSFNAHKAGVDPATGRMVMYDLGGWLMHEMRAQGLGFDVMPDAFLKKWYHIGNLTWARQLGSDPSFKAFKDWQAADIARHARAYRARRLG